MAISSNLVQFKLPLRRRSKLMCIQRRFVARGHGSSSLPSGCYVCSNAAPGDGQTLASRLCLIFGQSGFEPWAKSGPAAARTAAASASSGPSRSPSSFWLRRTGTAEKTTPPLTARVSASPVLPRPVGANQQKQRFWRFREVLSRRRVVLIPT